jgi:hypothetical protein
MATLNHVLYLAFSAAFTIGVGRSLFRNGRPFLVACFRDERTADAVNRLLLVGFYLMNSAFVTATLKFGDTGNTVVETIETLSTRIGVVVLTMGIMHFNNLYWCGRIRRVLPTKVATA